jgi:hypothetical protein
MKIELLIATPTGNTGEFEITFDHPKGNSEGYRAKLIRQSTSCYDLEDLSRLLVKDGWMVTFSEPIHLRPDQSRYYFYRVV